MNCWYSMHLVIQNSKKVLNRLTICPSPLALQISLRFTFPGMCFHICIQYVVWFSKWTFLYLYLPSIAVKYGSVSPSWLHKEIWAVIIRSQASQEVGWGLENVSPSSTPLFHFSHKRRAIVHPQIKTLLSFIDPHVIKTCICLFYLWNTEVNILRKVSQLCQWR